MNAKIIRYFFLILVFLPLTLPASRAQEKTNDSIPSNKMQNFKRKSKGLIRAIGHLLNDQDTLYISPNRYNLAFMLENSNWYEHYRIRSSEGKPQSLTISPNVNYKIGAYFGWRWIFLGWSIDVKDLFNKHKSQSHRTEFGLSLYSSIAGIDIYKRKSGNNFKIRSAKGFSDGEDEPAYDKDFEGLTVDIQGLNVYWVFNHRKFSYPAAYSQSTNQRKSAGSLIAGFSYSRHNLHFDYTKLPPVLLSNIENTLQFKQVKYKDYSLSVGYAYNWVFARNCLASLSLTPAIAYKKSEVNCDDNPYPILKRINFDLITRAGITWNNSKYFVGASLVMHTYDYRSDKFDLNNSFGTVRIYAGFNFWKKKQYKNL